jgi:hypothetical protein
LKEINKHKFDFFRKMEPYFSKMALNFAYDV